MRFTLALLATATAVLAQYPVSQISDGQIQNPTTPIVVYSTSMSVAPYPAGNSSVAPIGTSYSAPAGPTGIYSNSTASAGSTASTGSSPTGSSPAATSSTAPESTGAAVANVAGGFGLAAAVAALILA